MKRYLSLLLALLLAVLLYLLFSCLLGVVCKEDVLALPMGERLYVILKKMRLLPLSKDV